MKRAALRIAGILGWPVAERACLLSTLAGATRAEGCWPPPAVRTGAGGGLAAIYPPGDEAPRAPGQGLATRSGWSVALAGTPWALADGTPVDAEVLASRILEAGFVAAIERIGGDFAVAALDQEAGRLWLARDAFGGKPLYYLTRPEGAAISSRLGALLALPGVERTPHAPFVARFAGSHYRTVDDDLSASPFSEIHRVPPGHLVELRPGHTRQERYWKLRQAPDHPGSPEEVAEQYHHELRRAVRRRLASAPRPIFTLSGGMDSSSVLACAVAEAGAPLPAISTVYDDATYDESTEIADMLGEHVSDWHRVRVAAPAVPDLVQEMVEAHDEPIITATWLSHWLLCKQSRELGFESVFGGLGGDELNAGEFEHFAFFFADLRAAGDEDRLEQEIEAWARHHDHPIYRKDRQVAEEMLRRLVDPDHPGQVRPDRRRLLRYAGAIRRDYFDLARFEPRLEHPFQSYLRNRTSQDLTRETVPPCLRAEERQTAAFGLENHTPFLDRQLAEFAYRIPVSQLYHRGLTKASLRRAMRGFLPEATRTRVAKMGWNAPAHRWFAEGSREPLLDLIRSRSFRERGVYDPDEVERLATEHFEILRTGEPVDNHMMFLWQLINLETWFQRRVDRAPDLPGPAPQADAGLTDHPAGVDEPSAPA